VSATLQRLQERANAAASMRQVWAQRAQDILDAQNGPAREFLLDDSPYRSARCPRRAGKSFALASLALRTGELIPGARVLIISLTLKSTRDNYWTGPGSLHVLSARFGLNLRFNNTYLEWHHENGSSGRLAGAETKADIEKIRGALAEADLVILDEGKSFAPQLLEALYIDVIEPGLMTRDGKLVFAGTPGSIPSGRFFKATSPKSRLVSDDGLERDLGPTAIPWELRDSAKTAWVSHEACCGWAHGGIPGQTCTAGTELAYRDLPRHDLWSLHSWTIEDNRKVNPASDPNRQWRRALQTKKRNGWSDDHPTWRREYLGEWVTDRSDLVYAYGEAKAAGKQVTWRPLRSRENPTGLPPELGPWHLIMGLDFGFEDDFAVTLGAWSETAQELRQVAEFKSPHMLMDAQAAEIQRLIDLYGRPDVIVGDRGAQGKQWVLEMNQRYGFGILPAEKTQKADFQELLSSDFLAERIKILPDSELETELLALQWDLSKNSKEILARTGKLREDPECANHLADSWLYTWRYAYHFWSTARASEPEAGTTEYWDAREKAAQEAALRRRRIDALDPNGFARVRRQELPLTSESLPWRRP